MTDSKSDEPLEESEPPEERESTGEGMEESRSEKNGSEQERQAEFGKDSVKPEEQQQNVPQSREGDNPEGPASPDSDFDEKLDEEIEEGETESSFPIKDFTQMQVSLFNMTCVFYLGMALISYWIMTKQEIHRSLLVDVDRRTLFGLLVGAGIAGVVIGGGYLLYQISDWARKMEEEFAPFLNVYVPAQIPILALLSGVGEEFLFRGVLQNAIGLWPAAVIFGAIHFPWEKGLIPWPIFAFVLGVLFGYLVQWTGTLWGAIFAHTLINMINIYFIRKRNPMEPEEIMDHFIPEEMQ